MRVPWTARRCNQSILKEISPGISLVRMVLKLKLQYFGYLMRRVDSLKKTLMLGRIGGRRRRGRQRMGQGEAPLHHVALWAWRSVAWSESSPPLAQAELSSAHTPYLSSNPPPCPENKHLLGSQPHGQLHCCHPATQPKAGAGAPVL